MKTAVKARIWFISALFLLFLLIPAQAMGAVKYVTEGGAGAKDGNSWESAYSEAEFRDELGKNDNGEYWLAAGEYSPGDQQDDFFSPADGVSIFGGFEGNEISKADRDPKKNVTILTGRIDNTKNNKTVIRIAAGHKVALDGLTITGGKGGSDGGAVYCYDGAVLTAENCAFVSNSVGGWGGAVLSKGYFEAVNCSFLNNTSSFPGGAIRNSGGILRVMKSTFYGNSSTASSSGAISNLGNLTVVNSTFVENSSAYYGGGAISSTSGSVSTIINCTFQNNFTQHGDGEAILNSGDDLVIFNSILWGDDDYPQIHDESAVAPKITYCVIKGGYDVNDEANHIVKLDPRLDSALKSNGGLTTTLALLPGSSAIDAGTSADAPNEDQRGVARPQGGAHDIGAYEYDGISGGGGGCSALPGGGLSSLMLIAPLAVLFRRRR